MSSILNALKRLEQERPQRAYPRIWIRRGGNASGWGRWLGGLLALTLLVAAGGAAYYKIVVPKWEGAFDSDARQVQEPAPSPGASNEAGFTKLSPKGAVTGSGQQTALRSIPAPTKADASAAMQSKPSTARTPSTSSYVAPEHRSQAPQRQGALKTPAPVAPQTALTQQPIKDLRKTRRPPSQALVPKESDKASADPRSAKEVVSVTTAAQVLPATLLTNTTLKIQAISWSQIPQDRLAVVNSQLVREGQSIDGYRVKQINSDDMILSREGLDWMLKFVHN